MPSAEHIIEGLSAIARDAMPLAIVWHVVLALALVALGLGWRPSRRSAAAAVSLPAASVSALAFIYGNPINGALFAVLLLALLAIASTIEPERVPREAASRLPAAIGASMVAFGWLYPHFVELDSGLALLLAAPLGLLPCPTLAAMIGLALLGAGFGSRAWSALLAAAGLVYGLFGAVRLGVLVDLVLVAGAATLLVGVLRSNRPIHAAPRAQGSTTVTS